MRTSRPRAVRDETTASGTTAWRCPSRKEPTRDSWLLLLTSGGQGGERAGVSSTSRSKVANASSDQVTSAQHTILWFLQNLLLPLESLVVVFSPEVDELCIERVCVELLS